MANKVIDPAPIIKKLADRCLEAKGIECTILGKLIDELRAEPGVYAVEVVHGRWVFGTANHREYMKCSVCLKSQTPTGVFTYCPNCGAKMDGD